MSYPEDIKARLSNEDETSLVTLLGITSDDIVERFEDRILDKLEYIVEDYYEDLDPFQDMSDDLTDIYVNEDLVLADMDPITGQLNLFPEGTDRIFEYNRPKYHVKNNKTKQTYRSK